ISPPKQQPWNKGKFTGAKPVLRTKHVWSIRSKLQAEGRTRDLAIFNLAIEKKTGQPVRFEMTEQTRQAVDEYLTASGKKSGQLTFSGRLGADRSITTRQYAPLVPEWISGIGLDPHVFGTHSLRRTKATLIYRRTGNLRAVQLLLGHRKIESTVRY